MAIIFMAQRRASPRKGSKVTNGDFRQHEMRRGNAAGNPHPLCFGGADKV